MSALRTRSIVFWLVMLSLMVCVVGCGDKEAALPSPTEMPTIPPTVAPSTTPEPTATATITPWPTITPQPTWTPTPHPLEGEAERILFDSFDGDYRRVYTMDPDGRRRTVLVKDGIGDMLPAWSSSAGQLLFTSARDGDMEIYSLKPGDYYPRNLTNDPAHDAQADWAPDGARIVFVSDRDNEQGEIYVMDVDGTNVERLTDDSDWDWGPAWSPNGDAIAFVSDRGGTLDIWVTDPAGADFTSLTNSNNDCDNPAWSPGGAKLAFSMEVDDNWDIYLLDVQAVLAGAEDAEPRQLTNDPAVDDWPAWSPDGKRIAFQTNRTGNNEIYVLDPTAPFQSEVNLSRHAADDESPVWVSTPSLFGLEVADVAAFRLLGGNPTHLDPALSADSTSHGYVNEIFSGLVRLDENLEVAPDIATHWDVSSDGLVYRFYLRDDVVFHDGKPVTASDFAYSIGRALDPDVGSTTARSYLGDIVGVKEVLAGATDEISGVRVVDDYTLEITIDAPKSYFLAKLTYPISYVVDRKTIEEWGEEWERHPNGTGPFRLASWAEDELLVLVRNDLYYDGVPALKRVSYHMAGLPMLMYEEGLLETVPVGRDDVFRVQDPESPLHDQLVEIPNLSTSYVGFNCTVPPFDDPMVRQAFAYAFDRQKLVEVTFEETVIEATGILPPGMPGHNPDLEGISFDPGRAAELLAESTYGGPEGLPEITLVTSGMAGYVSPVAEAFVSQVREVLGVEMSIEVLESEDFFDAIDGEHTHQIYTWGWVADYADPENFLDLQFHSQSETNGCRYANPEVDALLERARTEVDIEQRWQLYQEAEKIIVDDVAWLPLFHSVSRYLVQPYVNGLVYTPQGIGELGGVTLDEHE